MVNKNLLKLQKYVWDMDAKALGKGFSLNPPKERAFSYYDNRMAVSMSDDPDEEMTDDEQKWTK